MIGYFAPARRPNQVAKEYVRSGLSRRRPNDRHCAGGSVASPCSSRVSGVQLVPCSHHLLSSREAPPSVETATEAASASGESPRRGRQHRSAANGRVGQHQRCDPSRLPPHCKRQTSHTGPVSEAWTSHRAIEYRAFTISRRIPLGADSPSPTNSM